MENRYVYKGQDLTLDIVLKIEHVVRLIVEKESRTFDECYQEFLNSKTYKALQNTESLMWSESAEFIVDEYYREVP